MKRSRLDVTQFKDEGEGAGPLLEVTDLHTNFRTDRGLVRAVDGVSFTVAPGEILGIAGLVGAGRTEVVRAIFAADMPESGEILVNGEPVESPRRLRNGDRVTLLPAAAASPQDTARNFFIFYEPASLVVPPRTFNAGRVLRSMDTGPERKFRLTKLLQRGGDFERVAFEES